jgi:MFS family permease
LNIQQAGYYTATPLDYAIVAAVSAIASIIAGGIAVTLINWWLIMLFYAPVAGSIIAEIIRRAIQKRRGKYISPLGCAVFIVGGLVGAGALPLVLAWRAHQLDYFWLAFSVFFQLGIWIFIVLGATTVYGRLRS